MKYTVKKIKRDGTRGPAQPKDTSKANRPTGGGARRDNKISDAEAKALGIKKGDHYDYR